jgi:hypothetical protein
MKGARFFLVAIGLTLFITGLPQIAMAQLSDQQKQDETGSLSGQVVDRDGSLLPGVKVTLEGPSLEEPLEVETNGVDDFLFEGLVPGHYKLTTERMGFITVKQEGIPVEAGRELMLVITMNPVETP